MTWDEHCCEECSNWDDINGCWLNNDSGSPRDLACPEYQGDDFDDTDCE